MPPGSRVRESPPWVVPGAGGLRLALGAQIARDMIYDAWLASADVAVGYGMIFKLSRIHQTTSARSAKYTPPTTPQASLFRLDHLGMKNRPFNMEHHCDDNSTKLGRMRRTGFEPNQPVHGAAAVNRIRPP